MYVNRIGLPTTSIHNQTMAVEKRKAHLICSITNDVDAPNPRVEWYKDGDVQVEEVKNRVSIHSNSSSEMTQSVLQFDPVSHTDSGGYTCRAYSDPTFYTESSTLLIVECKF